MAKAKLAVMCVRDKEGKPLFTEHDLPMLAQKASKPLERIYRVADRLSALSVGAIEDLAKN